jgi:dTDP-4-amino-4,6-dideoxygalactose transaminase
VATSSGTTALHLTLLAHGIGPGDEVIVPPFSFVASANAIRYTGATPVFADIDKDTLNLSPRAVRACVTHRTRAIVAVHLYGSPCDKAELDDISTEYGLALVEDACQAHGAEFDGRRVGTFGTGCCAATACAWRTSTRSSATTTV